MRSIRALLFVTVVTVLLIACRAQPDPTPTALPEVVTPIAATPTLVPVPDSAETSTPDPGTPPADLVTPSSEIETLPTPVIVADTGVTIVTPADGAEILAGDNLTVERNGARRSARPRGRPAAACNAVA